MRGQSDAVERGGLRLYVLNRTHALRILRFTTAGGKKSFNESSVEGAFAERAARGPLSFELCSFLTCVQIGR